MYTGRVMSHRRSLIASSYVACLALVTACSSKPETHATGAGAGSSSSSSTTSSSTSGGGAGGSTAIPCSTAGVSKGPWSLAIDGTSAKIRWEACKPGTMGDIGYAPETGGAPVTAHSVEMPFVVTTTYQAPLDPNVPPDLAGTYYMHEVALTGLTPATCYVYHLVADGTIKGRLCTARAPGDPLTFMAIGDTNPGLGPYAAGDLKYSLPKNPDFTLHGGDIQYYDSGLETWASWFPVMQPMLSQGGFFPAVGNHELELPTEFAQYTARFFGGAGFDGTAANDMTEAYYRFENAGVWFFSLDTEQPIGPTSTQGAWLVKELADASGKPGYRFSIVVLHRPFVTCGDDGDDPNDRALLEPFFLQYHVPIVIQAHMHGYERFEFGNITYLTIAGGGGRIGDPSANLSRSYCDKRVVGNGIRHAAIFQLGTGKITGTVTDYQGNLMDSFVETVP